MAPEEGGRPDPPDYKVYRSRRGILSGLRKPDISGLREKLSRKPGDGGKREPSRRPQAEGPKRWTAGRVAKWVGVGALAWLLLSMLAFSLSAQLQKRKLADNIGGALDGNNPFMVAFPQTILVLGTDIRSGQFAGPAEAEGKKCLEDVIGGRPTGKGCKNAPFRSDSIMLIRAGGGAFRQLSIPRDTLAEVPGQGLAKINAAYAAGGAKLAVETVEGLLGLDVDQVAIIDFDGFRRFIDSIGGIKVNLDQPVCSSVSGGAFKLDLKQGEHTLNGHQAITLARIRQSDCDGDGTNDAGFDDTDRAANQQLLVNGIKGRLTSVTRAPINFIKGPFIGWNAPKVMVSSMGGWMMPQLVMSAAIGDRKSVV